MTEPRLFTTRDVLPTGQTGFELSRKDRRSVRLCYVAARRKLGIERGEAARLITVLCELLDESPYGRRARDEEEAHERELDRRQYEHERYLDSLEDDRPSIHEAMFGPQG